MRKRLVNSSRWTWSAAALCLAAGLFLGWQAWRSEDVAPVAEPPSTEEAAPPESEGQPSTFKMPTAEEYEEIVMRPLFNRSRRPDAPQEVSQAGASGSEGKSAPAAQISLNGVVLARNRRVALLRLDSDPKVMHVAEGQQAGGWLIETIRPDRIILRRGDATTEVVLNYKKTNGPASVQAGPSEGSTPENVVTQEGEEAQD